MSFVLSRPNVLNPWQIVGFHYSLRPMIYFYFNKLLYIIRYPCEEGLRILKSIVCHLLAADHLILSHNRSTLSVPRLIDTIHFLTHQNEWLWPIDHFSYHLQINIVFRVKTTVYMKSRWSLKHTFSFKNLICGYLYELPSLYMLYHLLHYEHLIEKWRNILYNYKFLSDNKNLQNR